MVTLRIALEDSSFRMLNRLRCLHIAALFDIWKYFQSWTLFNHNWIHNSNLFDWRKKTSNVYIQSYSNLSRVHLYSKTSWSSHSLDWIVGKTGDWISLLSLIILLGSQPLRSNENLLIQNPLKLFIRNFRTLLTSVSKELVSLWSC